MNFQQKLNANYYFPSLERGKEEYQKKSRKLLNEFRKGFF